MPCVPMQFDMKMVILQTSDANLIRWKNTEASILIYRRVKTSASLIRFGMHGSIKSDTALSKTFTKAFRPVPGPRWLEK